MCRLKHMIHNLIVTQQYENDLFINKNNSRVTFLNIARELSFRKSQINFKHSRWAPQSRASRGRTQNSRDERKHSLDSLRTSLLVLHNFLHFVNLSAGRKSFVNSDLLFDCWYEFHHALTLLTFLHNLDVSLMKTRNIFADFCESSRGKFCWGKNEKQTSGFRSMRNCSAQKSMQHWAK